MSWMLDLRKCYWRAYSVVPITRRVSSTLWCANHIQKTPAVTCVPSYVAKTLLFVFLGMRLWHWWLMLPCARSRSMATRLFLALLMGAGLMRDHSVHRSCKDVCLV